MRSLFHSHAPEPAPTVEPVPTIFPKITGADVAAVFVGKRIAGDFYDSIRVSPERVLFGLMDVAGRREDNRHILIAAQDIFRNLGSELFRRADMNEANAMTELCLRINRGLLDVCCGVHSSPAFVGCYHEGFGTLCYTNAGHTPGLLRDETGVAELAPTGLPLGLFSHATCDAPTVGLGKGAALLLVSRGVIECGRRHEKPAEEFGLDRLKQRFQNASSASAQGLCTEILNAAHEFGAGAPMCDDQTALTLVRTA